MKAQDIIYCHGHSLVIGSHPTTFEITREDHLSKTGNCIIGIAADKGCAGLSDAFREIICHDDAILTTVLACAGERAEIRSWGSSLFTLDHPTDIDWRRSSFTCGRTIGIRSDRVAATLPKELIENLIRGEEMVVTLSATRPG